VQPCAQDVILIVGLFLLFVIHTLHLLTFKFQFLQFQFASQVEPALGRPPLIALGSRSPARGTRSPLTVRGQVATRHSPRPAANAAPAPADVRWLVASSEGDGGDAAMQIEAS
jgi:hypothetical protein